MALMQKRLQILEELKTEVNRQRKEDESWGLKTNGNTWTMQTVCAPNAESNNPAVVKLCLAQNIYIDVGPSHFVSHFPGWCMEASHDELKTVVSVALGQLFFSPAYQTHCNTSALLRLYDKLAQ
jgi:hypothetical protein